MSKKLFSLLYGYKNKISANQRILPADAVGKLLDAQEVLASVQREAEKYKLDIVKECELLKEKAQQEGYAGGYQQWAEHIAKQEEEIVKVRQDLEKMLIPVALKAAKKIVGREIELSEDTIVDIVANSLKAVSQHKKVTIYVNKKDLDPIERSRVRLKEIFENVEVLSLRERADVKQGGCVIETEGGIINAQLENQWSALERAFAVLMKKPNEKSLHEKVDDKTDDKTDEKTDEKTPSISESKL